MHNIFIRLVVMIVLYTGMLFAGFELLGVSSSIGIVRMLAGFVSFILAANLMDYILDDVNMLGDNK